MQCVDVGRVPFSPPSRSPSTCLRFENEADERSPLLLDSKDTCTTIVCPINSDIRGRLVVVIISCAGFLNIFTAQSTIILLPAISRAYDIPTHHQPLIASIYNVSSGCLILLWARLADVYGRRLIFLLGSGTYAITSILLPFSPTAGILFGFRALQGVSVAAVIPSSVGILTATFPEGERRNTAFVVFNAAGSLGAVLGNIVGGVIGGLLSWSWVFWLAAILGGMTTVGGFVVIDRVPQSGSDQESHQECTKSSPSAKRYVDWTGGLMITTSLAVFTIALSFADGQPGAWRMVHGIIALVLAILFVARQRRLERSADTTPLIRMSIFRQNGFIAALAVYGCFLASFNSFLIYVSFFFQHYQKLPVLEATLRFVPSGISCFLLAPLIPPLLLRYSHYRLLIFSILALLVSLLLLALPIPPSTPYSLYILPALLLTCSIELASPILSLFVIRNVAHSDQSLGGGLLHTANNMGKALGLAVASGARAVVSSQEKDSPDHGMLLGLRAAQWVNAALAMLAVVIAARGLRSLQNPREEQKEDEAT